MRPTLAWFFVIFAWGCSTAVVVTVPPRVTLQGYGAVGIVEFDSDAPGRTAAQATRQFQEQVHAAQPGTRFIDLGTSEALLDSVGRQRFDVEAFRRIREKYGVAALFLGELDYAEPQTSVKLGDLTRLEGGMRTEIRGELSVRLVETGSGASVWSSSAWARRELGSVHVSAQGGVTAQVGHADPREAMLPALAYQLTHDFRPRTERQRRN